MNSLRLEFETDWFCDDMGQWHYIPDLKAIAAIEKGLVLSAFLRHVGQ
jgi:hypothetical protein